MARIDLFESGDTMEVLVKKLGMKMKKGQFKGGGNEAVEEAMDNIAVFCDKALILPVPCPTFKKEWNDSVPYCAYIKDGVLYKTRLDSIVSKPEYTYEY